VRRADWISIMDDVAIVGGGPSGAWAAYCLATRGARVRLFDPSHPREKPCGGGVTGRALALVSDAIDRSLLPASAIASARFTDTHRDASAVVRLDIGGIGTAAPLIVVRRTDFDAALVGAAERAGAVFAPARVTNVSLESDGVRLDTAGGRCRARFVIGADGANSLVRRRLSRPFRRAELSVATGYFAHGVTSDEIVVELVGDPPGYIWSFPRPTHLAIGVCAQADARVTTTALRQQITAWMKATGVAAGAALEAYAWPIPSLDVAGLERLELSGPRWALVGDAAGLVDPITREGIHFALLSGQWAADALATGRGSEYSGRVREEIVPELARAARLKAGFFRPSFIDLLMHALTESAAIRTVMADLIVGRQTYAGLEWRLLKTCEARLAWRTLVREVRIRGRSGWIRKRQPSAK
jgi:geranylgeranyl reductase family protein